MKTAKKLIFMILVVAFAFIFAACNDEQEHSHSFVDGSCECGEKDPNYVTPHTHSYSSVVTAPTCTEAGYTTFTCECGDTYKEDGEAALGHTEVVDAAVAATCTEAGKTEGKHCSVCNEVLVAQEEVAALGHTEVVDAAVDATCTAAGKTEGKHCSVCNEVLVAQEEVAALGHTEVVDAAVDATCTEAGKTEGKHCSVCNEVFVAQEEIAALGHKFVDSKCENCEEQFVAPVGGWTLVTELKDGDNVLIAAPAYNKLLSTVKVATHYNKGIDYSTDDFSNVTEAEIFVVTINADGTYTFTSLTGDVIAMAAQYSSLNKDGEHKSWSLVEKGDGLFLLKNTGRNTYLEWYAKMNNWSTYTAGNTNEYELSFYTKGEATDGEHVHNHISSVHEATCTEAGYTAYTCRCGDTYKVDGEAALGHTEVVDAAVAATCTEAGKTEGKHCSVCNEVLVAQEEVAALGHSYKEGTCEVCGDKESSGDTTVTTGSADLDTMKYANTPTGSYTTYTSENGWKVENSALNQGGPSDANPTFKVFGSSNDKKAVTLNGKTSARGKLTSPVLDGGIQKLTFNYCQVFTGTSFSATISIKDASGTLLDSKDLTFTTDGTKFVVMYFVWELETPITGEFQIEIINNCPSNADSNKDRISIWNIVWEGAVAGHTHEYESTTTATCTAAGVTTYTCSCGDAYTEETEKLGHVDANLDIDCDREGCTSKVAPAAESTLSNFTANNLGSKLSTSSNYYVEGTISDVLDAKNGIFYLDDGTGEKFYFRLPVNEAGVSHANWAVRLVLGDKVRVYGKINKYSTSTAPNGSYYPAIQGGLVTLLEQHDHVFGEATCKEPAQCKCLTTTGEPLGHSDGDGDNLCDRCQFNVKLTVESVEVRTDNNSGVTTGDSTTWSSTNFDVIVAKGTSTQLYTTAKDHMRVYKGNTITISNKTGITVQSIVIYVTNATQIANMEKMLTGLTYTKNDVDFTITIEWNSADSLVLTNPTSNGSTTQFKCVEIIYEK